MSKHPIQIYRPDGVETIVVDFDDSTSFEDNKARIIWSYTNDQTVQYIDFPCLCNRRRSEDAQEEFVRILSMKVYGEESLTPAQGVEYINATFTEYSYDQKNLQDEWLNLLMNLSKEGAPYIQDKCSYPLKETIPDGAQVMRTITVHLEDGTSFSTNINGTNEEIKAYYVGEFLNVGTCGNDKIRKCVRVEFH